MGVGVIDVTFVPNRHCQVRNVKIPSHIREVGLADHRHPFVTCGQCKIRDVLTPAAILMTGRIFPCHCRDVQPSRLCKMPILWRVMKYLHLGQQRVTHGRGENGGDEAMKKRILVL